MIGAVGKFVRAAEPDFGHPISTHFCLETDDLKVNGSVLLSLIGPSSAELGTPFWARAADHKTGSAARAPQSGSAARAQNHAKRCAAEPDLVTPFSIRNG